MLPVSPDWHPALVKGCFSCPSLYRVGVSPQLTSTAMNRWAIVNRPYGSKSWQFVLVIKLAIFQNTRPSLPPCSGPRAVGQRSRLIPEFAPPNLLPGATGSWSSEWRFSEIMPQKPFFLYNGATAALTPCPSPARGRGESRCRPQRSPRAVDFQRSKRRTELPARSIVPPGGAGFQVQELATLAAVCYRWRTRHTAQTETSRSASRTS